MQHEHDGDNYSVVGRARLDSTAVWNVCLQYDDRDLRAGSRGKETDEGSARPGTSEVKSQGNGMLIPLTQGRVATVDDEFYDALIGMGSWYYSNGYAAKLSESVYMHRVVLQMAGVEIPSQVDHINGNKLDNRLQNLRVVTQQQNSWNRGPRKNSQSGLKGVCLHKPTQKWLAKICVDGKQKHLGLFEDKLEAARAYNQAAIEAFGEFAYLNPLDG